MSAAKADPTITAAIAALARNSCFTIPLPWFPFDDAFITGLPSQHCTRRATPTENQPTATGIARQKNHGIHPAKPAAAAIMQAAEPVDSSGVPVEFAGPQAGPFRSRGIAVDPLQPTNGKPARRAMAHWVRRHRLARKPPTMPRIEQFLAVFSWIWICRRRAIHQRAPFAQTRSRTPGKIESPRIHHQVPPRSQLTSRLPLRISFLRFRGIRMNDEDDIRSRSDKPRNSGRGDPASSGALAGVPSWPFSWSSRWPASAAIFCC